MLGAYSTVRLEMPPLHFTLQSLQGPTFQMAPSGHVAAEPVHARDSCVPASMHADLLVLAFSRRCCPRRQKTMQLGVIQEQHMINPKIPSVGEGLRVERCYPYGEQVTSYTHAHGTRIYIAWGCGQALHSLDPLMCTGLSVSCLECSCVGSDGLAQHAWMDSCNYQVLPVSLWGAAMRGR